MNGNKHLPEKKKRTDFSSSVGYFSVLQKAFHPIHLSHLVAATGRQSLRVRIPPATMTLFSSKLSNFEHASHSGTIFRVTIRMKMIPEVVRNQRNMLRIAQYARKRCPHSGGWRPPPEAVQCSTIWSWQRRAVLKSNQNGDDIEHKKVSKKTHLLDGVRTQAQRWLNHSANFTFSSCQRKQSDVIAFSLDVTRARTTWIQIFSTSGATFHVFLG